MSDERACDDETNNGKGGEVRVGLSSREAAGVAEVLEDLSRSLDTLRRGAEVWTCPPAPSVSPVLQPHPAPSPALAVRRPEADLLGVQGQ